MKTRSFAALALLAAAPAFAQTVTLDFEGAPGYYSSIAEFYNGGTDQNNASGPNYGVSFSDSVVAISNDDLGPYYAGAPTPLTVIAAYDANAFMNVAGGFGGVLTFAYSSLVDSTVGIYAGLNGTGALLGTASFSANNARCGSSPQLCRFDFTSVKFAGVAQSVGFGENAGNVFYDNISVTAVPEPSTYLLMALGLAAVGVVKRRRAG